MILYRPANSPERRSSGIQIECDHSPRHGSGTSGRALRPVMKPSRFNLTGDSISGSGPHMDEYCQVSCERRFPPIYSDLILRIWYFVKKVLLAMKGGMLGQNYTQGSRTPILTHLQRVNSHQLIS